MNISRLKSQCMSVDDVLNLLRWHQVLFPMNAKGHCVIFFLSELFLHVRKVETLHHPYNLIVSLEAFFLYLYSVVTVTYLDQGWCRVYC